MMEPPRANSSVTLGHKGLCSTNPDGFLLPLEWSVTSI